ncbi:Magnesium transporter [Fusarium keratoplasticum]|uniref:Magnesium transporter n=1 Tax=Fusarium keratoplasticum TaxID=1328300 RepID=A0ACC0QVL0_9HYPO|nr:Magnesium transporter [Fusarium keratoplasticum]KAI8666864.1 Magnesium transporter [Fusarium keratoplasticum]
MLVKRCCPWQGLGPPRSVGVARMYQRLIRLHQTSRRSLSISTVPRKSSRKPLFNGCRSPGWLSRLWFGPVEKDGTPGRTSVAYHHGDDFIDGSTISGPRRILKSRMAAQKSVRCTEVDDRGEVAFVDGELQKTDLIAKYGLLPRDLRKVDSSTLPHVSVRPSSILLNMLHLKVLIKHDRVLMFDVFGSQTSHSQSAFMYDLQGRLRQKGLSRNSNTLPFEFRALEAVLASVISQLEVELETVRQPIVELLSDLEDTINREKFRELLVLSKRVGSFEQRGRLVRGALNELLDTDEDLAAMYLTERADGIYRQKDDHADIELLLESYHKLCDELVQDAADLIASIRNTEDIIRAILDANRNSLMLLGLKLNVGGLGLAVGTFFAGLWGMNLVNYFEEAPWGFAVVTGASVAGSLLIALYGLFKIRKIQQGGIGMMDSLGYGRKKAM